MAVPERPGGVTFKGVPHTVRGPVLQVGQKAPDFTVIANDLSEVSLADTAGKIRLISVVPSLDTGLCDAQTRRFNEEATGFSDEVVVLTISADLPFAQKRWCAAAGVDRVQTLSCHRDMAFADAYGVHDVDFRWCQRAIFIVDRDDIIRYVEYVPEIAQPVNFEAALGALRELISSDS
ncbi:MAG TPA: thiol peroxidase [Chloroflexi bacterium]|nr:thiol peroxidase [Chloroflexota bacterium]